MKRADDRAEPRLLTAMTANERMDLVREIERLRAAVKWIVDSTHRPNPTDPSRIDVAPGQHRMFQAGIENAIKLLSDAP